MNRFFGSTTTLVIPLILAPFTLLLILSQNTVPGDLLYPYKRGVEIMVLAAASLHPETRVAFRTDLTERRFNEAETLLLAKQDVAALETFLKEVRETETAIANVPDVKKKGELKQTLIVKIDNYQTRLTQIETQVASQQPPTVAPTGGGSQETVPMRVSPQESILKPTTTLIPTQPPQPTQPVIAMVPPTDISGAIARTKDELEKIKNKTKKEKEEKEQEERKGKKDKQGKHDKDDDDNDDKKSDKRGVDKD